MHRGVALGDQSALPHIRPHDKCQTAVCVHVIGAILRVILDHENESVVLIRAARDLFDHQRQGVVVGGHLRVNGVDAIDRFREISKVIAAQTHKFKRGQIAVAHVIVKFVLPFLEPPVIRNTLVEAAIVRIGERN